MNKKLQKVLDEIEKTETKIAQWQEHLKMLLILEKLQKGEFQLTGDRYGNPRKSDFSEKEETKEETNGEREI